MYNILTDIKVAPYKRRPSQYADDHWGHPYFVVRSEILRKSVFINQERKLEDRSVGTLRETKISGFRGK